MLVLLSLTALAGVPPPGSPVARPTLSGPEATLDADDGFFRVHYTTEGQDAVPGRDDNADGTPDYAERVLAALELSQDAYLADGWRPVVRDLGNGGSDALDVYLRGVDINGYAYALDGETTQGGYACFIEIDPSLTTAGLILESVTVHELHHCVEYRYGLTASWIHEGSATAEQYTHVTDLGLQLAVNVLWGIRIGSPELAVTDTTGRYEYASFNFFKFWSDEVAERRQFWESLAEVAEPSWTAQAERAATDAGFESFDDVFLEYQIYNAFACGADDGAHYTSDNLACTTDATVPFEELGAAASLRSAHTEATHTTTFHRLSAGGDEDAVQLDCTVESGQAGIALVAVDSEGVGGEAVRAWGDQTVSTRLRLALDPQGEVRAIVVSVGDVPAIVDCTVSRVEPEEDPGLEQPTECGCATTGSTSWFWLAAIAGLIRRRDIARQHSAA